MVYRVELNLATHTLAMSEEQWNIGTLQRKRKPGKRGEVSSNISPIWQNQTSVLSNTHYDCGTKYNFRLFFTSDHPAFEIGRGEIRALSNAKLAELANLFWQTTVQKVSPCRFLSRYCNYSLTLVRTHTHTRGQAWAVHQSLAKKCTLELTNGHSALPVYILCLPSCM